MRTGVSVPVSKPAFQIGSFLAPQVAARLLLILSLALAVLLALYQLVPPAVVPASAPASEFSAERAMQHVRGVAAQPHPMGSLEHEVAATYIIAQLKALGLTPEVQETTGLRYDTN